ncbi:MAG: putative immunity protein, partial [Bacteroidia bacterium]
MKKTFTPAFIRLHKGCYEKEQVAVLSFIKKESIDIMDILNSEIPLKDKRWFLYNKCDLTLDQKRSLALTLAEIVLPIYEKKYPGDDRIRKCIYATKLFIKGEMNADDFYV